MMRYAFCMLLAIFAALPPGGASRAEPLKVAVSMTLPPFVFPDTGMGVDLEIVREALGLEGYDIAPVYVPYGRLSKDLLDGAVDGALTVDQSQGVPPDMLTRTYICYTNVAVSLEKNGFDIRSIPDLNGLDILAFQNAAKVLGPEFANMAEASPRYREIPNQENQVAMLYLGRTDVIVMDVAIFQWYRTHAPKADPHVPVSVARIFPPSCYSAGFRDENVRAAFNRGIGQLLKSGRYQEIFTKYGVVPLLPSQTGPQSAQ